MNASPLAFVDELHEALDDAALRVVATWEAWRESPEAPGAWRAFELVMEQHVHDLRDELATAGWQSARGRFR